MAVLKSESSRKPTDFYRSALRVGILGVLASVAYFWWWLWQFFLLVRREGLPRARAFWWVLVPIYGWIVIYRQIDDLDKRSVTLGRPGASIPVTLLILSGIAANAYNRLTSEPGSLIAFITSSAFTGVALYLVQRNANDYLKTKYPDATPPGMTWGEILATAIGLLFLIVAIASAIFPDAFRG